MHYCGTNYSVLLEFYYYLNNNLYISYVVFSSKIQICVLIICCIREVCSKESYEKFINFRNDHYLFQETLSGALRKCPTATCNYCFELDIMPVLLHPRPVTIGSTGGSLSFGDPDDVFVPSEEPELLPASFSFTCNSCNLSYCLNCRANEV